MPGNNFNSTHEEKEKPQHDNTRHQGTAPPQPTTGGKKKRNTTGYPPNHLHTDNNNCKYSPIIIYTYHTHTINFLRITTLANFIPTHFSSTESPTLQKSPGNHRFGHLYSKKKQSRPNKNTTEDLHSDNTRHPSNGDPATTSTGIWSRFITPPPIFFSTFPISFISLYLSLVHFMPFSFLWFLFSHLFVSFDCT